MKPQSSLIEIAGRKTQLLQDGDGASVLYLHSAAAETDWAVFHAGLAERYRVLLPAHPGFAVSGGLDTILDITDLAWHYVDFIESLQLAPVAIVGFSLGGWIAAELAILRPQLVRKLVLVSSAGVYLPNVRVPDLFLDDMDQMRKNLFFDPTSKLAQDYLPKSNQDEKMLLWIRAREATARVAWNPYFHNPRLAQHLHRIHCPTLLLWGQHDQVFPLPFANFFQSRIPQSRLTVLPECGHMLPFERHAEFVRLCGEFLG